MMLGHGLQARLLPGGSCPSLSASDSSPLHRHHQIWSKRTSSHLRYGCIPRGKLLQRTIRGHASNVNIGAGGYDGTEEIENTKNLMDNSSGNISLHSKKPSYGVHYLLSTSGVLVGCALAFSIVAFSKGNPSAILSAIAKSGFTAAFTLIFVSEIGDKTFFIAALLAMQYEKALVLLGSMGALSLMTILSVIIGRIFQSVPAQFQTINKRCMGTSSCQTRNSKDSPELGELVEAEELVKEKVAKKLKNSFEIVWKSFSLVFFAEWGDRSMLATIALGAAQSPWGVASGAIGGHLFATSIAVLGGAFLANYISEKLVGYLGGLLFVVFAVATLLGVF